MVESRVDAAQVAVGAEGVHARRRVDAPFGRDEVEDHLAPRGAQAHVRDARERAHGWVFVLRARDDQGRESRVVLLAEQLRRKGGARGGGEGFEVFEKDHLGAAFRGTRLAAARHPLQQLLRILSVDAVKRHQGVPGVRGPRFQPLALAASRGTPHHERAVRRVAHVRRDALPRVAVSEVGQRVGKQREARRAL